MGIRDCRKRLVYASAALAAARVTEKHRFAQRDTEARARPGSLPPFIYKKTTLARGTLFPSTRAESNRAKYRGTQPKEPAAIAAWAR